MKATDLREKTPDQLRDLLVQYKKERFNLRFRAATGEVENTAAFREARRNVAKVMTILNEKARAASSAAEE